MNRPQNPRSQGNNNNSGRSGGGGGGGGGQRRRRYRGGGGGGGGSRRSGGGGGHGGGGGGGFPGPRARIQAAMDQEAELERNRSQQGGARTGSRHQDFYVNEPADNMEYLPALFSYFPELIDRIPWTSLRGADSPSVPRRLVRSQHLWGENYAYFKREALDLHILPENKARKLEFVLGDVLRRKRKRVFSVGYMGSSLCFSLVKAARELNLKAEVVLKQCPLDMEAIEMTAAMMKLGAKVRLRSTWKGVRWMQSWRKFWSKFFPTEMIPMGGAVPLSVLGYVGALCELKSQMDAGVLPAIDIIYLPVASGSTLLGFEIGKRLLGLQHLEIRGVQIWEDDALQKSELVQLGNAAVDELNRHLKTKLNFKFQESDFQMIKGYAYGGHGHLPEFLERWMSRWSELEGIEIDRVYSAKALYGMSEMLLKSEVKNKHVLFWNTYSPIRRVDVPEPLRFKDLPRKLRSWIIDEEKQGRLVEVGRL